MARPTLEEVAARTPSFIKNRSDLDRLLRLLNRESEAAVRRLITIMDQTKDEKLAMSCAKALLEFQITVSEANEKREITRMIANIRFPNNGQLSGSTDDTPLLDFETITEAE